MLACLCLAFLSGCDLTLCNLTPHKIPQNPSGLYTITVEVDAKDPAVEEGNLRLDIVINGETYPMQKVEGTQYTFEYDYRMPLGQNEAKYYVIATYDVKRNQVTRPHSKTSDIYSFSLSNRYVVSLETNRGLVGSTIGAMGRGFTKFDRVFFNNTEAETTYYSNNSLSFRVPALTANTVYTLTLKTGNGYLPMGNFKIDASDLTAQPKRLVLNKGERAMILFSITADAPSQGIPLDITTDIPTSIIMPEVTLPSGARSVSVPLEAGRGGHGHLFVNAPGFNELTVPIDIMDDEGLAEEAQLQATDPLLNDPLQTPPGDVLTPLDNSSWEPIAD
jgi:hypothetical protein